MFEREFEFRVYHPIEVCEERILDMNKSGCFPPKLYRISSDVLSTRSEGYSEIYVEKISNRRYEKVYIEAVIEEIDSGTSIISGKVDTEGFGSNIVWCVFMGLFWIVLAIGLPEWEWYGMIPLIGFSLIWAAIFAIQAIHSRNHLIRLLEQTLTQPKKKHR